MSNRQERIARKKAQREGTEAFVHLKPQQRNMLPAPVFAANFFAPDAQSRQQRLGRNEIRRRIRRYGDPIRGRHVAAEEENADA